MAIILLRNNRNKNNFYKKKHFSMPSNYTPDIKN